MSSAGNLTLYELEKRLIDPSSGCYIENLLDVICTLLEDVDFPSAKNNHGVKAFIERFTDVVSVIQQHRTRYTDFEILKVIGQGGFGRVELVRHKRTRGVYALKSMSKRHILERNLSGFWAERDVMVKLSNEWLLTCSYAFMDKNNLYLCTEYMPGGDLCYWLTKYDIFDEEITRFYVAEAVLAVEVLHGAGFIHRDLKPDNMLLDAHGHLKLADFGSCIKMDTKGYHMCSSPIGTPDYISPEMLNCQSKPTLVSSACDWWALGVVVYEMLFGSLPFYGDSLALTYSRILTHEKSLLIPTDVQPISDATIGFIKELLKPMSKRLGSLDLVTDSQLAHFDNNRPLAAVQQIKSHPFFSSVQWDQLRAQDPPIHPKVNSETDTSNIDFDEFEQDGSSSDFNSTNGFTNGPSNLPHCAGAFAASKPRQPPYFTGSNLTFVGYTYNCQHRYLANRHSSNQSSNETIDKLKQLDRTEHELKQLKSNYQALECQSIQDQVNLKDLQRCMTQMTSQLDQLKCQKIELDKSNNELLTQILNSQSEREQLQVENIKLEHQVETYREQIKTHHQDVNRLRQSELDLMEKIEQSEAKVTQLERQLDRQHLHNSVTLNETTKQQIAQLETEIRESREKSSQLVNEVANMSHNHSEHIRELNAQLQSVQHVNHNYTNRIRDIEDQLEQSKLNETLHQRDLTHLREQLEEMVNSKRQLEDKLIDRESTLAQLNARLRTQDRDLEDSRKRFDDETKLLSNQLDAHRLNLTNLSNQLDEMRVKCATAETNCDRLTNTLTQRDSEIAKLNLNMRSIVDKLYSEVEGRSKSPTVKAHSRSSIDLSKYKQLEKKYKALESSSQREIADLHQTIEQYKKCLVDQTNYNKTLSEECEAKHKEISLLRQLERSLRSRLDYLIPSYSSPKSEHKQVSDVSTTGDNFTEIPADVKPNHSFVIDRSQNMQELLSTVLEESTDVHGLCKSKRKLKWVRNFAVLKPFVLTFYGARAERMSDALPTEEIPLHRIIHVREATALDLFRAKKDEISRTIQLFVRKQVVEGVCKIENDVNVEVSDTASVSSIIVSGNHNNNSLSGTTTNDQQPAHWNGHRFHTMRFRLQNVLCDYCHKVCSDLINPPPALECVNCRLRVHLQHVEKQEKIAPCDDVFYLRMSSTVTRKLWIDHINALKLCLRQLLNNPDQIAELGLTHALHVTSGMQNTGSVTPVSLKGSHHGTQCLNVTSGGTNFTPVGSLCSLDSSGSRRSLKSSHSSALDPAPGNNH